MSNLLNSTALQRLYDDAPKFGYAMAMKNDAMVDVGDRVFRAALSDPDNVTAADMPALYAAIRTEAETIGREKRKPMKEQTAKSKASQASKLACYPKLALCAQENDAVTAAYEWMREPVGDEGKGGFGLSGYTKVQSALTAMLATLAKDLSADFEALQGAIVKSQEKAPETASEAMDKAINAFVAAFEGTDKTPSPHLAAFARLLAANPHDPVKAAYASLTGIKAFFEREEQRAAQDAALAAGGLSV